MTYNAASQPTSVTYYNSATADPTKIVAVTSYTTTTGASGYDAMGRLTAMQETFGSTHLSYTWQYDPASNITSETSPDGTDTYTTNSSDELTPAQSLTDETYSYDQNGNRTDSGYVTGADNRLLSDGTYTYQYDKDGNRIERTCIATGAVTLYTWDAENRLVQETSTSGGVTTYVTYTYDYADRIICEGTDAH